MSSPLPAIPLGVKSSPDPNESCVAQLSAVNERLEQLSDRERFVYAGPFSEESASGFHGDRGPQTEAAFVAAEEAAEEHGAAELWIWKSDRLARGSGKKDEARSVLEVYTRLKRAGVTLRSVTDDEYVQDEAMIGMASKMANKYVEDLSQNVKRGKAAQFERGQRQGGPSGFGFEVDGEGNLVFDLDAKPKVDFMRDRALELCPPATVAREMNEKGWRTQKGKPWTRRAVQNILSNELYAGAVVRFRNRFVYRGKKRIEQPPKQVSWGPHHVAYMTREQFDAIQTSWSARDRAAKGRPVGGRPTTRYALSKLATCGHCGARMYASTSPYKRKDGTRKRRYSCANSKFATGLCEAPPIDAEKVDAVLVDALPSLIVDFEKWSADLGNARQEEISDARHQADEALTALDKQDELIAAIEADYERRILEDKDAADFVLRMLEKNRRQREGKVEVLREAQAKLDVLEAASPPADAMLDAFTALRGAVAGRIEAAAPEGLKAVNDRLREMFAEVRLEVTDEGVTATPVLSLDMVGAMVELGEENADGTRDVTRIIPPSFLPLETGTGPHE